MLNRIFKETLKKLKETHKRLTELPGVARGENTSTRAILTKSDILAQNVELFDTKSVEAI